jgi:hypothetical protein
VELVFSNGDVFALNSFGLPDLRRILAPIRAVSPSVIDNSVDQYINKEVIARRSWRHALQPGDTFIFASGAIFLLLALLWWALQKFWIG